MFGVLKGLFRIFKTPCMFHKKEDIDNFFLLVLDYVICCMLGMVETNGNAE